MEKDKNSAFEFSFIDFWNVFVNHILSILIVTTIFLLSSLIYTFFVVTPDYISRADVMIQVENDNSTSSDPNFDLLNALRLIDTVAELMTKEVILENSINRLEEKGYENLSINDIRENLSVSSSSTSYFINISYVDPDKNLAKEAVDSLIEAVIEETDVENAFPVLTNKIRRTSYASDAVYNSPNNLLNIFIGTLLGFTIITTFLVLKEIFANNFKSKEHIENTFEIPVLAVIPIMMHGQDKNEKK